jgi:hypothetical protein
LAAPRSPVEEAEARDAIMHVRLTKDERATRDEAAKLKALDTSEWVRSEMFALARSLLVKTNPGGGVESRRPFPPAPPAPSKKRRWREGRPPA